MFQSIKDQIPNPHDLMPPTLVAIYQLVGMSREGVNYTRINSWITDGMPPSLVDYITPTGSIPLIEARLASARSLLHKEGLIQRGNRRDGSNIRGHWALTPKGLRLIERGGGGSGAGLCVRLGGPPSSGSGHQSLVPPQTHGLTRSETWGNIVANIVEKITRRKKNDVS